MNFYNERDKYAAEWLRALICAGHIPAGIVDERSIEDVRPDELAGFTQCHFFAGLGGWPLALRSAGYADDRPVWTGSCPCQPFSAAGKGGGFADERHLWPAFDWLVGQCRPDRVLGEQVEGPAGRQWLDLVATDLEGHGYAFGTAVFPAAGVGAPQIRHRTYWTARRNRSAVRLVDAERAGLERYARNGDDWDKSGRVGALAARYAAEASGVSRLARADEGQRGRLADGQGCECDGAALGWHQSDCRLTGDSETGGVADAVIRPDFGGVAQSSQRSMATVNGGGVAESELPGPVNGFWRASDWLYCRDDKWRPVEPGTFPLASGAPARVGRLRAYGNAICIPQAQAFIEAVMST